MKIYIDILKISNDEKGGEDCKTGDFIVTETIVILNSINKSES